MHTHHPHAQHTHTRQKSVVIISSADRISGTTSDFLLATTNTIQDVVSVELLYCLIPLPTSPVPALNSYSIISLPQINGAVVSNLSPARSQGTFIIATNLSSPYQQSYAPNSGFRQFCDVSFPVTINTLRVQLISSSGNPAFTSNEWCMIVEFTSK